ncbi:hypothetical protein [Microvirga massiliensis]|uniref:hypothetical protein n=1 Tax=Microvirga massiliensis TaxID=1033741 RepID=UPI00062B8C8A|nr:hypothetical protein [Microvirga massiliensis]
MEPILVFYGPWTIEVTKLVLDSPLGPPEFRLVLSRAGAADVMYQNPPVGTQIEADGPEWALKVEISFDLQPFRTLELARNFAFDPNAGMTATVEGGWFSFQTTIALRLTAHDPELRAHPAVPYDFTIPERPHPHGG